MKIRNLLFCLLFIPLYSFPADTGPGPMEYVQVSTEKVLSILRDPSGDRDSKWQQISQLIYERFDIQSMSQSILATNWKSATPEERRQFVDYLSQYIESTYRSKIEAYTNQKVQYLGEKINGDRAVVVTVIQTDATEIPVNYKMKKNNDEWFVYDVVIEGVSMINSYRRTFSTIVKNEGMDGLLLDIEQRIQRHKEAEAEAASQAAE